MPFKANLTLWISPRFTIKLETPTYLNPVQGETGLTQIAYAQTSKHRQQLRALGLSNRDIHDYLPDLLGQVIEIVAQELETKPITTANMTGTLIAVDMDMSILDQPINIVAVAGLQYRTTRPVGITQFIAFVHPDEAETYIAERLQQSRLQ